MYLVTSSLVTESPQNGEVTAAATAVGSDSAVPMQTDEINLTARVLNKITLTRGEWEVLGKGIWIDYKRCLVYFMGFKETPLEKHLYVVSYNYKKNDYVRILTTRGFSYTVEINDVRIE